MQSQIPKTPKYCCHFTTNHWKSKNNDSKRHSIPRNNLIALAGAAALLLLWVEEASFDDLFEKRLHLPT